MKTKERLNLKRKISTFFVVMVCLFSITCVYAKDESPNIATETTNGWGIPNFGKPPEEALTVPSLPDNTPENILIVVIGAVICTVLLAILYKKRALKTFAFVLMSLSFFIMFCLPVSVIPLVHATNDFGNPLTTDYIGLFAYYNFTDGFTLTETVPVFLNYTDHGNYYDGFSRVYPEETVNTYTGNDAYIDAYMRIRADGWLLVWFSNISASKAYIPYHGHSEITAGNPVVNATCLSRAMQYVFYVTSESFPDHENISYYDFEFEDTTKLLIFSDYGTVNSAPAMHYIFPSGVVINAMWASWGCAGHNTWQNFGLDDDVIHDSEDDPFNIWFAFNCTAYTGTEYLYHTDIAFAINAAWSVSFIVWFE